MVVVVIVVVEGFSVTLHFAGGGDVGVMSVPGQKKIQQIKMNCVIYPKSRKMINTAQKNEIFR